MMVRATADVAEPNQENRMSVLERDCSIGSCQIPEYQPVVKAPQGCIEDPATQAYGEHWCESTVRLAWIFVEILTMVCFHSMQRKRGRKLLLL